MALNRGAHFCAPPVQTVEKPRSLLSATVITDSRESRRRGNGVLTHSKVLPSRLHALHRQTSRCTGTRADLCPSRRFCVADTVWGGAVRRQMIRQITVVMLEAVQPSCSHDHGGIAKCDTSAKNKKIPAWSHIQSWSPPWK